MERKIISVLLALVLCVSLAVSAAGTDRDYIIDEQGYLASSEVQMLNQIASDIYEGCGVGIFFVYTTEDSLQSYDINSILGGLQDYFIMMENDTGWYTFRGGRGELIDLEAEETLRDIYDRERTYVGGVEQFLLAAAKYFPAESEPAVQQVWLLDGAGLISTSEYTALIENLEQISRKHNVQICIATIASLEAGSVDTYVNTLYDSMGMGYGENHDGILLLVCMDPREYRILSNGRANDAIASYEIDEIGDAIRPCLSGGDYVEAFETFLDECDYYLTYNLNGESGSARGSGREPFNFFTTLLICLAIGLVVGLTVALILKAQLKSVRQQNRANVYIKPGSMQVTIHNDLFLYRNVTRTKRETNNTSSRGGGGSSRSVGGGSF